MTNTPPLITIIIAVFNGAKTMARCLDSIAAQTYSQKQVIIMDGGSTDGTVEILRQNSDALACWKSEPDNGIYDAWNKGLRHATGDWICFIGADDYFWQPDSLAQMAERLSSAYPPCRIVYGKIAILSLAGSFMRFEGDNWDVARPAFRRQVSVPPTMPHRGMMHHRSIFDDHGVFDASLKIAGDYDLLVRELKTKDALFADVVLLGCQMGGISNTPSANALALQEHARIREKYGLPRPSFVNKMKDHIRIVMTPLIVKAIGDHGYRTLTDTCRRLLGKPTIWR